MEPNARVLLVDDDAAVLTGYSRVLKAEKFVVECASNGAQAEAFLETGGFDVVVTDLRMPSMDGIALLQRIRARDADLPVILLTGSLTAEAAANAIDLGIMRCLLKPVDMDELAKSVSKAVALHRLGLAKREALRQLDATIGEASDRATLEGTFERTLGSMWMAFQPIVKTDGALFGYEALMRSREPLLPHPGAVLDAAERLAQLPELGRRIRQLSLLALKQAPADALLFINLHPQDLLDDSLYSDLAADPEGSRRLVLELTERSSMDEVQGVRERVQELRQLGCRLAIDDLGAGYAGLASFVQLEPDIVKLDMSLIRDADKSPLKRKLIGSLTSVCHELGVLVVAEGIETLQERAVATTAGCHLAQGYLFGKPAAEFARPVHQRAISQ
jgi:EAL domain-containing protein (putative c-di-GMP-specific phosphodiesterase class I)